MRARAGRVAVTGGLTLLATIGCGNSDDPQGPTPPSVSVASSAAAPAPPPRLSPADAEAAWRYAVSLYVFQGVVEKAIREHDVVLKDCGAVLGESATRSQRIAACASDYTSVLKKLKDDLPTLRVATGCPGKQRDYAERLLERAIAKSKDAPHVPHDEMGRKSMSKRHKEQPPAECPELAHFRCRVAGAVRPCTWIDLRGLWAPDPLSLSSDLEPIDAITLTDGTPVTRESVEQRVEDHILRGSIGLTPP